MKPELALTAVLAIILFSMGDALAAAWGKTGKIVWFIAMLVAGNLAWILFAYLNKSMPLAAVSGIVNLGLVIVSLLLSWLVFQETLLLLEKIAIGVGLVALALFVAARATAPVPLHDKNDSEVHACLSQPTCTNPPLIPENISDLIIPERRSATTPESSSPPLRSEKGVRTLYSGVSADGPASGGCFPGLICSQL